jgi:prevent-host-death family protein
VDVAVTELRARLSVWLDLVRHGEEVVITDRGLPVARLLGLESTPTLERLTDEGVIARPVSAQRPRAAGRPRPRPGQPIAGIVSEQRG